MRNYVLDLSYTVYSRLFFLDLPPPRIRHLLWQRQQKSATANAFFKRRHIAHDMRDIQEYPGPKVNTKELVRIRLVLKQTPMLLTLTRARMALGLTTPLPTTVPGSTM